MSDRARAWWRRVFGGVVPRETPPPPAPTAPGDRRGEPRWPAFGPALIEWIDAREQDQSSTVHLVERSENGIAVRSPRRIDAGWPVLLTFASEGSVRAVVRNVGRDGDGWRLGLRLIRRERRRFDRRPVSGRVRVVWQGADGSRLEETAALRDVGEGGVRLSIPAVLPVGCAVTLHSDGVRRFGRIVQRFGDDRRFEYGVQFSGPPIADRTLDYTG